MDCVYLRDAIIHIDKNGKGSYRNYERSLLSYSIVINRKYGITPIQQK
jgi:hypothetical protein